MPTLWKGGVGPVMVGAKGMWMFRYSASVVEADGLGTCAVVPKPTSKVLGKAKIWVVVNVQFTPSELRKALKRLSVRLIRIQVFGIPAGMPVLPLPPAQAAVAAAAVGLVPAS